MWLGMAWRSVASTLCCRTCRKVATIEKICKILGAASGCCKAGTDEKCEYFRLLFKEIFVLKKEKGFSPCSGLLYHCVDVDVAVMNESSRLFFLGNVLGFSAGLWYRLTNYSFVSRAVCWFCDGWCVGACRPGVDRRRPV